MKNFKIILMLFLLIMLTGCTIGGTTEHIHDFTSDKFETDSEFHWTVCEKMGCTEISVKEKHTFDEGVISKEATELEEGLKIYTCTVCNYELEEIIDRLPHTHVTSGDWDANETYHWINCGCGNRINIGNHVFGVWVIETYPTIDQKGEKYRTCTKCGYVDIEEIPMLEHQHTFETEYSYDEEYHYYEATCGHSNVVDGKEKHQFDEGKLVKPATTTETGLKVYKCVICDYELEEILSKTEAFEIEYDLGFVNFKSKDELYKAFFGDFYQFILEQDSCDMAEYDIYSVDDFLGFCLDFNALGGKDLQGVATAFSKYFLKPTVGGKLEEQPNNTFMGYCYANNLYIDLIEYLEVFFAYWRTDEGYTTPTNNGNDFYASAWAALIDTLKYFSFTSESILDVYPWFTSTRSPRVHYALEHHPYEGEFNLVTNSYETVVLPKIDRMYYDFIGWVDEAGNFVYDVSSDAKVYAVYERTTYDVELIYNGESTIIKALAGKRLNIEDLQLDGYAIKMIIDDEGHEYDLLNAVVSELKLHVLLEKKNAVLGTLNIVGYNYQGATSSVKLYDGIRLYKKGASLDASLYWFKVGINVVDNEYLVTSVTKSGTATPTDYDYLMLVYSSDTTQAIDMMTSLGIEVGNKVEFSVDLDTLEQGECNFTSTFKNDEIIYNLVLFTNGSKELTYQQLHKSGKVVNLPTPIKPGYRFLGWYETSDFSDAKNSVMYMTEDKILYAKWEEIVYQNALDYVSDVVTSYTEDVLPSELNGQKVIFETSNNNLYTIKDGKGFTNRLYQTHEMQFVTVTVTYEDGTTESKNIQIDPVLFDELTHPKAVYYSVGSANSYKNYSERYQKEQTLFSEKFRNNMDMVYYAFGVVNNDGSVSINTNTLSEVLKLKNDGIRVLLVIDGANQSSLKAMVKLCDDQASREVFVDHIIDLVQTYNFDGVDIDWEFPGTLSSLTGFEKFTTDVDIKNMNSLLSDLRDRFNQIQDPNGSNFLLTVATPPTYWGTDRYDYKTINQLCDYVNMMSYDLNKSGNASHLTHVYQPSNSYSYKFCCDYGVSYYTGLGLDKNKIILGCAAYGKAYKLTGTVDETSKTPGLGVKGTLGQVSGYNLPGQSITWNSGTIYYTGIQILMNSGNFKQYEEYNDQGKFVGSYLYSSKDKVFITFDSVLSVKEKCQYAKANEGMGIMVWAYGEDATDTIVNTICDNLK